MAANEENEDEASFDDALAGLMARLENWRTSARSGSGVSAPTRRGCHVLR
jgi:hypothetical protein